MRRLMLGAARKWCFAEGKVPHEKLAEAVNIVVDSSMEGLKEEEEEEETAAAGAAMEQLLELEPEGERAGIREAMGQLREFMAEFGSGEEMEKAMRVEEVEGEGR